MDYLQQLLKDQKVEWKKLGEVAQYSKTRIDASLLNENNYVGVDNLLQNCKGKTFSEHVPTTGRFTAYAPKNILIGNIRPYLKKIWFADNEGGTNGDVLVIQTTDERVLPEYLYQVLSDDAFFSYDMQHAKGAKMPRGNKDKILDYIIPLPPLSVQSRIVEILDKFTALEAELEAELELRKKQYQHYREQLLNFSSTPPHEFNVIWRKLGEVCEVQRGASPRPIAQYLTDDKENGIPWIKIGDTRVGDKYIMDTQERITQEGAKKSRLLQKGDFVLSNSMSYGRPYILGISGCIHDGWASLSEISDTILPDFLYYYLSSNEVQRYWDGKINSGSVSNLNADIIKKLPIPLPPLSVQSRIVEILDKFDALTNSITEGLPLEIKLRKQQYEYYREQLLDFRN